MQMPEGSRRGYTQSVYPPPNWCLLPYYTTALAAVTDAPAAAAASTADFTDRFNGVFTKTFGEIIGLR